MKYTYRNITELDQDLIGFGFVKSGETIDTDEPIYNGNFELVTQPQEEAKESTQPLKPKK